MITSTATATATARATSLACAKRRELAQRYAISARQYAEAAVTLTGSAWGERDFDERCKNALEAQERAGAAHAAFVDHVRAHGC